MKTTKYTVSLVWANDNHTQNSIYTKSSEHASTVLGNAINENKHFISDYKLVSYIVLNVETGNVELKSEDDEQK